MNEQQARAFFARLYRGAHHVPSGMRNDGGGVWSVNHYGELSTFDYDDLTRLVFIAHELGVRAWVKPGGARGLRIFIQQRTRSSPEIAHGHPTIHSAIAKFEQADDLQWYRWTEQNTPNEPSPT